MVTRRFLVTAGMRVGAPVILMLAAAACGSSASPETPPSGGSSTNSPAPTVDQGAPKMGGTLRISYSTAFLGLDPHKLTASGSLTFNSWIYPYLFHQPVGPASDPDDYSNMPYAAESWTQDNDTTYTVRIKQGIKWPAKDPMNGREMTADDVKYSYDRLVRISPYAPQFPIKSTEVVDKYTVRFNLKDPYAPFLQRLSSEPGFLLPREVEEKFGDFTKPENAMGNGPFFIKDYQVGTGGKFVFQKNPEFFMKDKEGRQLPYMDEVHYIHMVDTSAILTALRTAQLDLAGVPWPSVASIKASNPEIKWHESWGSGPSSYVLRFRTDQKPFDDVRVRRAISMAIDRDAVAKTFFLGNAVPNIGPIGNQKGFDHAPEKFYGDAFNYYKYDVAAAKKLMAEAGYADGFEVPTLYTTNFLGALYVSQAEWIAGQLAKIGIKAKVQVDEYAKYQTSTLVGEYNGMAFNPTHPYQDPDDWLYLHYYPGAPFDATRINDAKLNELILAQRKELNPEKREKLVLDAERRIADLVPTIQVGKGKSATGVHPWVKSYAPFSNKMTHGNNGIGYMQVWLDGSPTQK